MTHIIFNISGTIAKITELESSSSTPHLQITLPEDRHYKGETTTVWHNIQVWGTPAESAAKHLYPGSVVSIDVRVDYNKTETQTYTNFNAQKITYLANFGSKKKGS